MDYKFLFLVGSSLEYYEDNCSIYTPEQRFRQTLDTIDSIRSKVPNSYICIFENSYKPISDEHREILKERVDLLLEFYDDRVMKLLYENISQHPNLFLHGKSLLETRGLLCALYHLRKTQVFADARRIFKLSGRYTLNEDFNVKDYESNLLDKYYVCKVFEYPQRERDELTDNLYGFIFKSPGSMVTGLWSFDRFLFNETVDALEKSFVYMEKMIQTTCGIDIEHSLYYYLDKNKIIKSSNLGLNVVKGMETSRYKI